jgi:hypothetical protein
MRICAPALVLNMEYIFKYVPKILVIVVFIHSLHVILLLKMTPIFFHYLQMH